MSKQESNDTDIRFSLLDMSDGPRDIGRSIDLAEVGIALPDDVVLPEMKEQRSRDVIKEQLVAGASAEGHGVLVGWSGSGEITLGEIVTGLKENGLPELWAPKTKGLRGYAGAAVQALGQLGYVTRTERKVSSAADYQARWTIGDVGNLSGKTVDGSFGSVGAIITLYRDGHLETEGHEHITSQVTAEYQRTLDQEVLKSSDVNAWLRSMVVGVFGGIKFGGCYYVPKHSSKAAEVLLSMVAQSWGRDWLMPALPVATTEQLQQGVCRSLRDEVLSIHDGIAAQVKNANTRGAALGLRAVGNAVAALESVLERVTKYQDLVGLSDLKPVERAVQELLAYLGEHDHDTAARGRLVWEEIARG